MKTKERAVVDSRGNSDSPERILSGRSSLYLFTKRLFDVLSSLLLFLITLPLFIVISIAVKAGSKGPLFHVSDRVGQNNKNFNMLKFRTMRVDTPQLATHLMTDPDKYLTSAGRLLRKTSLDELPQLLNVIKGDMSVVGPRPALFNQDDQISLRTERGVHRLMPGITGWAQTHGRDDIPISRKVELDTYYMKHQSFALDMRILWLSLKQAFLGVGVSH